MTALFHEPFFAPPSDAGATLPGAKLNFYQTGTTTRQDTYTTSALSVAHANPVVADANGRFPPIYLDPSLVQYKAVLTDANDVEIDTVDPYVTPTVAGQSVTDKSSNYTTTASDNNKVINLTASGTISLGDAATVGDEYTVTVKNSHSASITVDLDTATDSLDGTVNGSIELGPNSMMTFITNSTPDGYFTLLNRTNIIIETADHTETPVAGRGEYWVRNDTPNVPMFTDDAGTDHVLNGPTENPGEYHFAASDVGPVSVGITTEVIAFTTEDLDPKSDYDSVTNHRYQPSSAGVYMVQLTAYYDNAGSNGASGGVEIRKNGSLFLITLIDDENADVDFQCPVHLAGIVSMNGTTDYLDARTGQADTGEGGNLLRVYFSAYKISD